MSDILLNMLTMFSGENRISAFTISTNQKDKQRIADAVKSAASIITSKRKKLVETMEK